MPYLRSALLAATRGLYRLDPGAQIGLITFANQVLPQPKGSSVYRKVADANDEAILIGAINAIYGSGGTNQRAALNFYWNSNASIKDLTVFTQDSTRKQVAILITDGAPNQSSVNWTNIGESGDNVRKRNVDLYTLGLSLNDVGQTNKDGLNGIAGPKDPSGSTSTRDASYAFQAEKGEEFAGEIKKMLLKILDKASLVGDVTDTIDAAFYPVDENGNPIAPNTTVTQSDGKQATYVKNEDGTWTATYHNVEIGWPEVDSDDNPILDANGRIHTPGWKTSIYVKAKEDFMGGNDVKTNVGMDDQVKATGYKQQSAPDGIRAFEQPFTNLLETPSVNVDELTLTENSTEWRVYLGTDVDPERELQQLWNKIRVNQVIKDNGVEDERTSIVNSNQMYYADAKDNDAAAPSDKTNDTLLLSSIIGSDILSGLIRQLDNGQLTASADMTYRYLSYGRNGGYYGTFDIVLTKALTDEDAASDHAPENHETKETGNEREVYTLTVTYNPTNNGASETYDKTTSGHTVGKVADGYDANTGNRIDSENTHKIHVFAKNLEITKQDMSGNNIDTAKFKLYRSARYETDEDTQEVTYENGTEDLEVDDEIKKVVQIGDEMSTSGGIITVNNLSYSPDGTYYLVETEAPAGYIIQTSPIVMHLYLDNTYTHYLAPHGSVDAAFTAENPYNWTQTVTRFLYNDSENGTGDVSKFVMTVYNNPGVSLPNTGGPGTTLIYLLGIMLTAIAGAVLLIKRRLGRAG